MVIAKLPGFTAEASLRPIAAHYHGRRAAPTDATVTPAAQHDWTQLLVSTRFRQPVEEFNCPFGTRPTYVEQERRTIWCEAWGYVCCDEQGKRYWKKVRYECGWEFVAPHWECRLPPIRVLS